MRVGIFGGTFDPPHVGHLVVAQDAAEALRLDRLFWVPARRSPFKSEGEASEAGLRLRLVARAIQDHPIFQLWSGELDRPEPSYTVDTVEAFRASYPGADLFLLLGTDQWRSFHRWKRPDRIAELASICVLGREVSDPETEAPPGRHEARRLPSRRIDISSTEIRKRLRQGRSVRYLVTDAVHREIAEHGLYAEAGDAASAGRPS